MPNIVVVGAGVSGLTCAFELAKLGHAITVVAKHMPGDYDAEYASPYAGANLLPMADEKNSRWERRTWPYFRHLAASVPEAGVHFQRARVLRRTDSPVLQEGLFDANPWFSSLMDDFRRLDPSELPSDVRSGCEFTSVCINTMLYLPWLVGQCRARGVVFRRGVVAHIADAAALFVSSNSKNADVVVNATGLLSHRLGGVADPSVFPIRGQVVVVRNEAPYMLAVSGTDDEDMCYVMTRAAGGGTVLGGTFQVGQWNPLPDPDVAVRIMQTAVAAHPELTGGRGIEALDIVRHAVALRPGREGGVRLEKERIGGVWVVHNYGHGAVGYQASFGCAERVVELVQEVLGQGAKL